MPLEESDANLVCLSRQSYPLVCSCASLCCLVYLSLLSLTSIRSSVCAPQRQRAAPFVPQFSVSELPTSTLEFDFWQLLSSTLIFVRRSTVAPAAGWARPHRGWRPKWGLVYLMTTILKFYCLCQACEQVDIWTIVYCMILVIYMVKTSYVYIR
jgi:hypothetical protein